MKELGIVMTGLKESDLVSWVRISGQLFVVSVWVSPWTLGTEREQAVLAVAKKKAARALELQVLRATGSPAPIYPLGGA